MGNQVSYLDQNWTVTNVRGDWLELVRADGYRLTVRRDQVQS